MPHIDLQQLVQIVGYPGLFAIIFLESGVFFGFFLPGASLLFTTGILAASGLFDIRILLPVVIAAAILGDNVGYWFGAKVGHALFKREDSRFFKKKHLEQTRAFFGKYGKSTIVLARFVPIVRTFAPILAGVGSMEYRTFFFYNALGGILWAGGVSGAGFFLGRAIPNAESYLAPIIASIVIVSCIPLLIQAMRSRKITAACPRTVVFDLDGTLAESKQPMSTAMGLRLADLLSRVPVAVMSGAAFHQFEKQFLPALPQKTRLERLYLFPTNAAQCRVWEKGVWSAKYDLSFTEAEIKRITAAIEAALAQTGLVEGAPRFGERIEDRGAQVTLSALGQEAPLALKSAWDPHQEKRRIVRDILLKTLPDFQVGIGGATSIDVTRKGIHKAYGVLQLARLLGARPAEMLYVGDALFEGGNDAVVIPTGIGTRQVAGPVECAKVIDALCAICPVL